MSSSGKGNSGRGKAAGMFLLGATLAFGLALAAFIVSRTALRIGGQETIRVKGTAVRAVESDRGVWNGRITVRNPDLVTGYRELERALGAAEKLIGSCGFKPAELSRGTAALRTVFKLDAKGNSTGEIRFYVLSRDLAVESGNVKALEKLAGSFSDLMRQGIWAELTGLSFLVSDLDRCKMELLAAAARNGRERAATLAENSGGKVGALLSASQGVFQVLAPGSGDISDCGTYDRSTVDKEIRAVVTLTFGVR